MANPVTAIVIGAGIVGCLVARELAARDPGLSITVLDQDGIGTGASRRSAGVHLPRGATPRTQRMSAHSHDYYRRLRQADPDVPIYPFPATVVSAPDRVGAPDGGRPAGGYLALTEPARADGVASPDVRVPPGMAAWRIDGCHYTDVSRLTQLLAARLRPRVRFAEGVTVTGLTLSPDAVTVDCGTGERLVADYVVLAPGPWLSAPAWRDLIAPLGLRVKKIVALHIEQRPGPGDEAMFFDDDDAFLLPVTHRGHWLFSFACQEWDVDPAALDTSLSAADLGAARDCLQRYSPALAAELRAGRVFCDAYSPAREPVVQVLDGAPRVVFAGGTCGSGYRLAPAIAADVADLLPSHAEGVTGDHQYV
jgi:glycine/D-amino acid oxidase-like deaminating enzyme